MGWIMKYIVRAEYEFEIEADSEDEALRLADLSIKYNVCNVQTLERVDPIWTVEEK